MDCSCILNTNTITSCITAAASLITGFCVLFTLFEMQKQRQESYKPFLVLKDDRLIAYHTATLENFPLYEWFKESLQGDNKNPPDLFNTYSIDILNIGRGAAKEINTKWKFDIKETVKQVNEIISKQSVNIEPIEISEGFIQFGGLMLNLENDYSKSQEYKYLLPDDNNTSLKLRVPKSYIILSSIMLHQSKIEDRNSLVMPELELSIQYHDIGGKSYSYLYNVKANIGSLCNMGNNVANKPSLAFEGYFEIK